LGTWGDYEEPHKTTTMQGQEDGWAPSSLLVFDYHHQLGCNKCQQLAGHNSQSRGEPKKAHNCLLYLLMYAFSKVRTCKLLFRFFYCMWLKPFFFNTVLLISMAKKYISCSLFRAAPSMMPGIWAFENKSHIHMVCLTIFHVPLINMTQEDCKRWEITNSKPPGPISQDDSFNYLPCPTHKTWTRVVKGEKLLITNHFDQSINLANQ
jgi:hypothetical protein